jgi:hypothetical protein
VQRLTALLLGLIFLAVASPTFAQDNQDNQGKQDRPGSSAAPLPRRLPQTDSAPEPNSQQPKSRVGRYDGFMGVSYAFPPISIVQQVVYCPVEGTCSVPGTIDRSRNPQIGWEGSATRHFTDSFGLTVDVTGNYGLGTSGFPHNAHVHQYTFLGGPQYYLHPRHHLDPFIHALFGATHQSIGPSGNAFFVTFPQDNWGLAAAIGGGIDARVGTTVSFRLVQADYVLTHLGGNIQSSPRLSAGLVFHF